MARVHFAIFILVSVILLANFVLGIENKESDVSSIVMKIKRRGLVPRRSLEMSEPSERMMKDPKDKPHKPPKPGKEEEKIPEMTNNKINNLQCTTNDKNSTNSLIAFDEFNCKSPNNGEYTHNIELIDGTRHKEEGLIVDGHFTIRGFFFSKEDPMNFHIYIKDHKGFHYFIVPIKSDGTQEYGLDGEFGDICSVRGDSCIDPKILASMLG